jgi:hypothetical protein
LIIPIGRRQYVYLDAMTKWLRSRLRPRATGIAGQASRGNATMM